MEQIDVVARERIASLESSRQSVDKNTDEIWRAIDALRGIVQSNALESRDLLARMDQALGAMASLAKGAEATTARLEDLTRRVTEVESARTTEQAEEKAERRLLMGIATVIGAIVGPIAIWLLTSLLKWVFPALVK